MSSRELGIINRKIPLNANFHIFQWYKAQHLVPSEEVQFNS